MLNLGRNAAEIWATNLSPLELNLEHFWGTMLVKIWATNLPPWSLTWEFLGTMLVKFEVGFNEILEVKWGYNLLNLV